MKICYVFTNLYISTRNIANNVLLIHSIPEKNFKLM